MTHKPTDNSNESGAALIAVLCLIFTAGILTATTLALSKSAVFNVTAHVKMQRSMLVSEGVANRVMWLLAADRSLYSTSEQMGETVYDEYEYDRYLADGTPHTLDYYGEEVQFTITDARSGVDLSSDGYAAALNSLVQNRDDSADWTDGVAALQNQIADYVDSNGDTTGDDGLEEANYDELNMRPLPRNAAMQFREELLYLPAFRDLFTTDRNGRLDAVRLIPPENTVSLSGAPSLMTASDDMLKSYCNLEDGEVTEVREAINAWLKERTPLSESLDSELLGKLGALSRTESGNYTITVEAAPTQKRPYKRLTFSFAAFPVTGPENQKVKYLEWMFH
jgi:hypothetical protein